MSEILTWLLNFLREFKFLVIVLPWEQALRVRLGNHVALWAPGAHFRLPFVDHVELFNTRLRVVQTGTQTLTTADGRVLTVALSIGFRITEPALASLRFHSPENTLQCVATSQVAELVASTKSADLKPAAIEAYVLERLIAESPGFEIDFCRMADFVYARTFRFLNESTYRNVFSSIDERKV